MWEFVKEVVCHGVLHNLQVLPFLFLTYLLMEFIEKKAEDGSLRLINSAGKWGPVLGGALGIVPQCGFSAATANLYACGVVTRGTLLAVFLSTSDEMLPILISNRAEPVLILKILASKLAVGVIAGLLVDWVMRLRGRRRELNIHEICHREGCDCEHGVLRSALLHTVKVFLFLVVVTIVLNAAVELVGHERLANFILNRPVAGQLLSGVIGLIPNCAASVVITQLYLQGGMSAGAMISGLLVGSGVGVLVLFRMNRNVKDNLITVGLLYCIGVAAGVIIELLPIF